METTTLIIIIISILLCLSYVIDVNDNNNSCDKNYIITTLARQAARWTTAARQDVNPMIAVLHANYGAGYLWALRDIFTDSEIEEAGIEILKLRNEIIKTQDSITINLTKLCPKYAPPSSYLTNIGGEGNTK